jgi:phage terminase large subunit-like protein
MTTILSPKSGVAKAKPRAKRAAKWTPGKRVLQARERLVDLRKRYAWDEKAASAAVTFIEKNLRHWKEPFAGKPFVLSDWQKDEIIRPIWGLRKPDGTRLIREVYLQMPRKNGKTALAAAISLLVLALDGDGVEVYSAATTRFQARIVYKDAQNFIRASPALRKRMKCNKTLIEYPARRGIMTPLSSEAGNLDGLNVSCAVIDELHAHTSNDLHDVLLSAAGTRTQPLILKITTAGSRVDGICHDQYDYSCKILDRVIADDSFLAWIAEADKETPWDSPEAYRQANPNIGVSVQEDYLESMRQKAIVQDGYRTAYKRYHLDQWVTHGVESWLSPEAWAKCGGGDWTLKEMEGQPCFAAFDLSQVNDLTAFSIVWPGARIRTATWYWLPGDDLPERMRRDRAPYDIWVEDGWLELTPGPAVDHEIVAKRIIELCQQFKPKETAFDDWNAVQVVAKLTAARIPLVNFVQGLRSFHQPTQEFERLVITGGIEHDDSPVSSWCVRNTSVKIDVSGKVRPVKMKVNSTQRIDGTISMIMALDCALRSANAAQGQALGTLPNDLRALIGA